MPIQFFSLETIKLTTLAAIAFMLLIIPVLMRHVERQLPTKHAPLYRKYATDTYVQTIFLLLPIFLAAYNGLKTNNLTIAITLAFLSICFFGGLFALWNARKSWIELRTAKKISSNAGRLKKITDMTTTTKAIIFSGCVSTLLGGFGLLYTINSQSQPTWFWFVAFIITAIPISLRAGSNAVLTVASKYANDAKFGEV